MSDKQGPNCVLEGENAKLKAALMEIAALNWSTYNAAYDLLADVQDIVKAALAAKAESDG